MKRSPLASIFLIVAVDVLGFTIILPLLPFYAESFGASALVVGTLISTYGFCQLIAGPILGHLSDRFGRKPVLLVSQCGTLIGFLILAFARSLPLIFLSRIIDGITAGNLSVAQAYISDVTEAKDRAKSFGLIGIAFGLGFLIGPAISGVLAHFNYQYPIFAAAGLSLASILATYFLLPRVAHMTVHAGEEADRSFSPKIYSESFRDPALGPLLRQFASFIFTFVLFMSGFALFAERRFTFHGAAFGAREVGVAFAYAGFLGVIIQGGLIGRLVKRFGEARLVKIGFVCMFSAFLCLSVTATIPLLALVIAVYFFGSSVLRPSLTSLITLSAGKHRQGVTLGLTQSLMSISQVVAPLVCGVLIEHMLLRQWAWLGAFAAAIGVMLSLWYRPLKAEIKSPV
ncbi:MAG: MFS transporter [Candidatus Omnitrophica bacterium]|nr:MFS transporter [Candidatus Omnitrophota bacterium]